MNTVVDTNRAKLGGILLLQLRAIDSRAEQIDIHVHPQDHMYMYMQVPIPIHVLYLLFTEEIDECASNPCANDGNCTDVVNGYTCDCVAGYTGSMCEVSK